MSDFPYDPRNWYWAVVGHAAQLWSSARAAFVPDNDSAYEAWLEARPNLHVPTRIASLVELRDVLTQQFPGSPNEAALTALIG
jgi:hypothetical protein